MIFPLIFLLICIAHDCLCINRVLSNAGQEIFTQELANLNTDQLRQVCCVSSPTAITGPTTITLPGQYAVANSFTVTDTGITIASNDVSLDLGNFIIDGQSSGQTGIAINSGVSNTQIFNGLIRNMTLYGIYSQGSQALINNCTLTNNLYGLYLSGASYSIVDNCNAYSNQLSAFYLNGCNNNFVKNCNAINTSSAGASSGFFSTDGLKNVFDSCATVDTSTTSASFGVFPIGIGFAGTETESSIVNSTIKHTYVTNTNGLAQPFGIALNASATGMTNVSQTTFGSGSIYATGWGYPPNSDLLLAIGGQASAYTAMQVYLFDPLAYAFEPIASAIDLGAVNALSWSSTSAYLAAGGTTGLNYFLTTAVYAFNETTGLSLIASTTDTITTNAINFSPNNNYIAAGNENGDITISQFDRSNLNYVTSVSNGAPVYTIQWSPSGNYLAVGGDITTQEVSVYSFNGSTLTLVASSIHGAAIRALQWSINGDYLVVGGDTSGGVNLRVYQFSGSSLTQVATASHGASVYSVAMSPRGVTIGLGGADSGGVEARIYTFTGAALIPFATYSHGATIYSLSVDPIHNLVSLGGAPGSTNPMNGNLIDNIRVLGINISTVSNCIIQNNNVFFTNGGMFPGIGLSAITPNNFVNNNNTFGNDVNQQL